MLAGVTESGLFSQLSATIRDKPDVNHCAKTPPNSTEPACDDNMKGSSPLSDLRHDDTNEAHQKTVEIMETDNEMITYSVDKNYSDSQILIAKSQGTFHAFTVALALSVHSIFEGLAFGLQDTINEV